MVAEVFRRVPTLMFLLSFAVVAWNYQTPPTLNFDETHYIPAAKGLLAGEVRLNREHPPLGKYFIAMGIDLLGDNSEGWRIMGVIFGAATIAAAVMLAEAIGFSVAEQWMLGILTLSNQMFFVLSRIGMLDIFMLFFLIAAYAGFFRSWLMDGNSRRTRVVDLVTAAIFIGLSIACKWSSIFGWAAFLGWITVSPWLWRRRIAPLLPMRWMSVLILFLTVPTLVYTLSFIPFWSFNHYPVSLMKFLTVNREMFTTQTGLSAPHGYMSQWYTWPVMYRPIWFKFEAIPHVTGRVWAILFVGNPLIAWLGLIAIGNCTWRALRERAFVAALIAAGYFSLWLPWAAISRKVEFLYYYAPAFLWLGYAAIYSLRPWPRLKIGFAGAALICFVLFFPVISAMEIPTYSFTWWTWFQSWR